MYTSARYLFEFGPFRVDTGVRRLYRDCQIVPLTAKVFDILEVFVQNSGRTLTKEELIEQIWPEQFVEEGNLTRNISTLRKALGESPDEHLYIVTLPGRGYRFVASVKDVSYESQAASRPAAIDSAAGSLEQAGQEHSLGLKRVWEMAADDVRPETFVGREVELQRLEQLMKKTITGGGRILFITGEPGIGKTALANQFLGRMCARNSSPILSRGCCLEQYGQGEAYLPFLDALGSLLFSPDRARIVAALRTYAPTWCLQFPGVFNEGGALERLQRETIGATKERMLREMGDALGALAVGSPLVLLLEDLHWADHSSIDLLGHLGRRIHGQRLLLVGTLRHEDAELHNHPLKNCMRELRAHDQCEEMSLGLLGQNHMAEYLNTRFSPNDFPPALAALISRKTEGHPLFATSLAQYLAERDDIIRSDGDCWTLARPLSEMDLETPENVRSMIRRKVESLPEEERQVLFYASIEGEEFTSTVLAALLGLDDLAVEDSLDRLDKIYRLVVTLGEEELPDGGLTVRYRFSHVLYRDFLYKNLVSKRRQLLHRQAGEELAKRYGDQSHRVATKLALHFERGRDFSRAVEYLIRAGDNAERIYAHTEAEGYYTHALSLVEKLPVEIQTARRFALFHRRGQINFATSRFDHALEDFTRMLDCARCMADPSLECAALNALSSVLFFAHRLEEMGVRAKESLRVAEASGNETLRVEAMTLIARQNICLGYLVEAKAMLDESIRVARSLSHKPGLLFGLAWRGLAHFFQSEYDSAEHKLTEALGLSAELREGFMLFFCLYFLGVTRGEKGHISRALETFDEIKDLARRNGERYHVLKVPNSLGWLYRELEAHDFAIEQNRIGAEVARDGKILEAEINSVINLSYDCINQGKGEKTGSYFSEAEDLMRRDEWFTWRFNIRLQAGRCRYFLHQNDLAATEECSRRLLEIATHHEAHKYMAEAHKLLAEVALARNDQTLAETELSIAIEILRDFPTPLTAWRIYAALGRLRSQMGQNRLAGEAFAEAAAIIGMIADNISDERLRTTFLNSISVSEALQYDGEEIIAVRGVK
jgi:DNA-binding winged helix-turn-helix (wHTH) protein/tetratricopeptide (TPR) repeat protein